MLNRTYKNEEQLKQDMFHDIDPITWDDEPEHWKETQHGRNLKAMFRIRGLSIGQGFTYFLEIQPHQSDTVMRSGLGFMKRHDARMAARWFDNAYKRTLNK